MGARTVEQLNALIVTSMRLGNWDEMTALIREREQLNDTNKEVTNG